jgi:hypothetical protein
VLDALSFKKNQRQGNGRGKFERTEEDGIANSPPLRPYRNRDQGGPRRRWNRGRRNSRALRPDTKKKKKGRDFHCIVTQKCHSLTVKLEIACLHPLSKNMLLHSAHYSLHSCTCGLSPRVVLHDLLTKKLNAEEEFTWTPFCYFTF